MPPSPSASRAKVIIPPSNRKLTEFFKSLPAREDLLSSTYKSSHVEVPRLTAFSRDQPSSDDVADEPRISLNDSFTSVSTLSSVPPSTSSSSRRVVKDGLLAITNSDSDSASSDEGLADVSTFVARKRRKITPPLTGEIYRVETNQPFRKSSRISAQNANRRASYLEEHTNVAAPRTYKYSLHRIARQHAESTAVAAKVAALVADAGDEDTFGGLDDDPTDAGGRRRVAAEIAKEGEDGERVLHALQRTEALEASEKYYFFAQDPRTPFNPPFPVMCLPSGPLKNMLASENTRTRAFLSGFVAQVAVKAPLETSIIIWLAAQLLHETRKELCEAYLRIIEVSVIISKTSLPDLAKLETFFAIDTTPECTGVARRRSEGVHLAGLERVCRVVQLCARLAGKEALARAFADFALANVDDDVATNPTLRQAVHDALVGVADAVQDGEEDEVFELVRQRLLDDSDLTSIFRCQVLKQLPATSSKLHRLRRRLALFCITREADGRALSSSEWATLIVLRMKEKPEWVIGDTTDYTLLTSLADVVDIAIDAGFSPSSYPWLTSPSAATKDSHGHNPTSSSEEKAFNAQIDELTARLSAIKSHIKAGGAAHLRRMEARSALERVEWRLAYDVRTRPRPQHDLFALDADGGQRRLTDLFSRRSSTPMRKHDHDDDSGDDTV